MIDFGAVRVGRWDGGLSRANRYKFLHHDVVLFVDFKTPTMVLKIVVLQLVLHGSF